MGQVAYRANLSAASYPMTVAEGGRTVIIPGPDNNFDRRVDPTGAQKDAGIPQALYLENVMPTTSGFQSVGYLTPTAPMTVPGGATKIIKVLEVWSSRVSTSSPWQEATVVKMPLFFWDNGTLTADKYGEVLVTAPVLNPSLAFPADVLFSTAVINGFCYLYFNQQLFTVTHNPTTGAVTLTDVTATVTPLNFFSTNSIIAICSSNNYLIAISRTTVYYSSVTTPTDFVSSLVSGAGQINPNNSDGALQYIVANAAGFYIFSSNNTILAQYTGNARYPWKFTPVKGSNGLLYPFESLIYSSVDSKATVVCEAGKQIRLLGTTESNSFFSELNDLLSANLAQSIFEYTTNTFTEQRITTTKPMVNMLNNRYVFVSINNTTGIVNPPFDSSTSKYTHVIVFDIETNRFGRLKISHDFMFVLDRSLSIFNGYLSACVGFVDGTAYTIKYLNMDMYETNNFFGVSYEPMQGVLVLGKFQYVRSRFLKLEEIEIEGPQNTAIVPSPNFSCVLLPSLDGRNFSTPVPLTPSYLSGGVAKYPCHNTAQNQSIAIKGAFSLNTVQLRFTPAGER